MLNTGCYAFIPCLLFVCFDDAMHDSVATCTIINVSQIKTIIHIQNQEIFDNLGNSGKASTSIAGIAQNFWILANTQNNGTKGKDEDIASSVDDLMSGRQTRLKH